MKTKRDSNEAKSQPCMQLLVLICRRDSHLLHQQLLLELLMELVEVPTRFCRLSASLLQQHRLIHPTLGQKGGKRKEIKCQMISYPINRVPIRKIKGHHLSREYLMTFRWGIEWTSWRINFYCRNNWRLWHLQNRPIITRQVSSNKKQYKLCNV